MDEIKEVALKVARIAEEQDCFLSLGDYREATVILSTMDIYDLPKIISDTLALAGLPAHKFKRAIIPPKISEDFYFFETVTLNRGQNTKLFQDVEEAKKWLFEE
ncbi:MAG: hypothetical protein PHQ36_13820 [Anaerolineales bacterium]|nr:hypothetical protein [Anaerolineales bacterium]